MNQPHTQSVRTLLICVGGTVDVCGEKTQTEQMIQKSKFWRIAKGKNSLRFQSEHFNRENKKIRAQPLLACCYGLLLGIYFYLI